MEWALVDKQRIKAEESGTVGLCPGCGGEVRAKCGEIISWHWAHINADCDPWSEPESEWHRKWKGYFPAGWQEVTKPPHRADVAGPAGVLEIQRSGISPEEIREREQFYGQMAWLINGHDFWENLEWIKVDGDYYQFRWKHARKTWITANKIIFIDTPFGLFKVKNIKDGQWKVICGSFVKAAKLMQSLDPSGKTCAGISLLLYDSLTEQARVNFLEKGQKLTQLFHHYVSKTKAAFLDNYSLSMRMLCEWRDYSTVYDFLLKACPEWVDSLFEKYNSEIAIAQLELNRISECDRVLRSQLIKDFTNIRPEPINGFDSFETFFIEDCIASLLAAKERNPHFFP